MEAHREEAERRRAVFDKYRGPYVVLYPTTTGTAYRVRDLTNGHERIVSKNLIKVIQFPAEHGEREQGPRRRLMR